jgi:hypothetical protein
MISEGQLFRYAQQQALDAVFRVAQSPAVSPTGLFFAILSTPVGALDENAVNMGDPSIQEFPILSGYTRQQLTLSGATNTSPSLIWNNAAGQWGPFSQAPGTAFWAVATDQLIQTTAAATIAAFLLGTPRTPEVGDTLVASPGNGNIGVGFLAQV